MTDRDRGNVADRDDRAAWRYPALVPDDLPTLLQRVAGCFPPSAPITLAAPVAFDPATERWRGHARRWFAASDGQVDDLPFWDAHSLTGVAQALDTARICDDLRAQPEGYWVEPSWVSIASDHAGHHLMLDDDDGRVLSVAHDDDHVAVLAPSPEAWLEGMIVGHADGALVWDVTFGLIGKEIVDGVAARGAEAAARAEAPQTLRQKLLLALYVTVSVGAVGLYIAWLELEPGGLLAVGVGALVGLVAVAVLVRRAGG